MIIKSFLAGVFVSIGATTFLISGKPLLFTIGIFLVFNFSGGLITGYIPLNTYLNKLSWKDVMTISLGNLLGSYLFGIMISKTRLINSIKPVAEKLVENKTNDSLLSILILSMLCVSLIGYGVIGADKSKGYIEKMFALMFPTFIFVVCGFEHMVANMFYITISGRMISSLPFLIVSIIGNILGGVLLGVGQRKIEE